MTFPTSRFSDAVQTVDLNQSLLLLNATIQSTPINVPLLWRSNGFLSFTFLSNSY